MLGVAGLRGYGVARIGGVPRFVFLLRMSEAQANVLRPYSASQRDAQELQGVHVQKVADRFRQQQPNRDLVPDGWRRRAFPLRVLPEPT